MKLDRVTITGADSSVPPNDLVVLSYEFPFVEWGILISKRQGGAHRFPPGAWIDRLLADVGPNVRLSLHVCGRWVRQLMVGEDELVQEFGSERLDMFQRIQLNTHAELHAFSQYRFANALMACGLAAKQIIVQMDGTENQGRLGSMCMSGVDAVPLFDTSGGAGILPREWPRPISQVKYHGYAGGLGPDNVLDQLLGPIGEAVGPARIWIDMERKVRSDDDSRLDLYKVQEVLGACAPMIARFEEATA